jgi:hypothetical protein
MYKNRISFSFTSLFEYNECHRLSGTAVREIINDIVYKVGHPTSVTGIITLHRLGNGWPVSWHFRCAGYF